MAPVDALLRLDGEKIGRGRQGPAVDTEQQAARMQQTGDAVVRDRWVGWETLLGCVLA